MKVFSIVLSNNDVSLKGFERLKQSSKEVGNNFEIDKFEAIQPGEVKRCLNYCNIRWNWPETERIFDKETNLWKHPYSTKNQNKRIACALSHYLLWINCKFSKEPILILEHDALFIEKFKEPVSPFEIVGINDPRGATRKSSLFHSIVQNNRNEFQPVPKIDDESVPQGLAGNSAYYITPEGAQKMVDLVLEYGLWPNDAIMCYQLHNSLGVTRTYYTKTQGLESTTSL